MFFLEGIREFRERKKKENIRAEGLFLVKVQMRFNGFARRIRKYCVGVEAGEDSLVSVGQLSVDTSRPHDSLRKHINN